MRKFDRIRGRSVAEAFDGPTLEAPFQRRALGHRELDDLLHGFVGADLVREQRERLGRQAFVELVRFLGFHATLDAHVGVVVIQRDLALVLALRFRLSLKHAEIVHDRLIGFRIARRAAGLGSTLWAYTVYLPKRMSGR